MKQMTSRKTEGLRGRMKNKTQLTSEHEPTGCCRFCLQPIEALLGGNQVRHVQSGIPLEQCHKIERKTK